MDGRACMWGTCFCTEGSLLPLSFYHMDWTWHVGGFCFSPTGREGFTMTTYTPSHSHGIQMLMCTLGRAEEDDRDHYGAWPPLFTRCLYYDNPHVFVQPHNACTMRRNPQPAPRPIHTTRTNDSIID